MISCARNSLVNCVARHHRFDSTSNGNWWGVFYAEGSESIDFADKTKLEASFSRRSTQTYEIEWGNVKTLYLNTIHRVVSFEMIWRTLSPAVIIFWMLYSRATHSHSVALAKTISDAKFVYEFIATESLNGSRYAKLNNWMGKRRIREYECLPLRESRNQVTHSTL